LFGLRIPYFVDSGKSILYITFREESRGERFSPRGRCVNLLILSALQGQNIAPKGGEQDIPVELEGLPRVPCLLALIGQSQSGRTLKRLGNRIADFSLLCLETAIDGW
jgi:hypothetical protein